MASINALINRLRQQLKLRWTMSFDWHRELDLFRLINRPGSIWILNPTEYIPKSKVEFNIAQF